MRFSIKNLWFKSCCRYCNNNLAKGYVMYSIECTRLLSTSEWNALLEEVVKFTLRNNRLFVYNIRRQYNTIYFIGKQSHVYGYSWDKEIIDAFYPLLNPLAD